MENVDQGNLENESTCGKFLRSLRFPPLSTEHSDGEGPPIKRTKLDDQNWYPIDRIPAFPEYIKIRPCEKPRSGKREYSSSTLNDTYSSEMGSECPGVRQRYFSSSFQDVVDVQGPVKGLTTSTPVFSTGMVSSYEEISTSTPETPVFNTGMVSFYEGKSSSTPVLSTGIVSSYEEKLTSINNFLTCKVYPNCTLYPPANGNIPKPTMKRPLGCKTVSIAGLSAFSHESLKEVLEDCGEICNLKRKNSNFRVTFTCESAVDKVLELNGYTLVSLGKKHLEGRIQINYVVFSSKKLDNISRVEIQQKEKTQNKPIVKPECKERKTSLEPSYLKSKFSKNAVRGLLKKMRGNRQVNYAPHMLIRWIEEGECNQSNSFHFFNILNVMQGYVSKLMSDIVKLEESILQQQSSLRTKYSSNSAYFVEILKAFDVVSSKYVFNKFSSKNKNKIEVWKKKIKDIVESNSQDGIPAVLDEKANLPDSKRSAENLLEEAQLTELKHLQAENERLKKELRVAQREAKRNNDQIPQGSVETKSENQKTKNIGNDNRGQNVKIVEKEAWLIVMIGAFLNFHRFGENTECICKYLLKIDPTVTNQDVECLMRKLPTVFKKELVEGTDDFETKWTVWGI